MYVYTCRPGPQEFSATRVEESGGGSGGGGGGGQIKLRREIYGRACNEQLFHGMRTPGLASGGGISIRSSSCRPRARGLRPLLRVALLRVLFRAKRKRPPPPLLLPLPPPPPPTRATRCTVRDDVLLVIPKRWMHRNHFIASRNSVLRCSALNPRSPASAPAVCNYSTYGVHVYAMHAESFLRERLLRPVRDRRNIPVPARTTCGSREYV